ncbi:response regulator [Dehalogenimonas etheniformans]|uniref:response regulator n=1 Tax=Dehalogenimonas etheniformans TaxID=1536648 RepID=UPI00167FDC0C|nr:response regulator [Dehalogenimonas etheniformans]QOE45039.1 response regulator [Dehalogenimonas etheniformans]
MSDPACKKRILIVDDEPYIGKIFSLKLKLSGYDVAATCSGAEAIELVRNDHFDAVLLDIFMPEVTGLDVLDAVRKFSKVPIIVFSARTTSPNWHSQWGLMIALPNR